MRTHEGTEEKDERIRRTHGDEYEQRESDRCEGEEDSRDDDENGG